MDNPLQLCFTDLTLHRLHSRTTQVYVHTGAHEAVPTSGSCAPGNTTQVYVHIGAHEVVPTSGSCAPGNTTQVYVHTGAHEAVPAVAYLVCAPGNMVLVLLWQSCAAWCT